MTNDELAREVAGYVDTAIQKNRRTETILVVLLVLFAATGLGLLILGAILQQGLVALPGVLGEVLLIFPVRELVKLRRQNVALLSITHMIRMADEKTLPKLVQKLIEATIRQIES